MTPNNSIIDFFISYTESDEKWAELIACCLEDDMGYKVYFKKWDLLAGGNYVIETDAAMRNAEQTIVVLSEEYLSATFEWTVAISEDSIGKKRKLLPIKVQPVNLSGNLKSITAIDLIGLSQEAAKQKLLDEIKASKDGIRKKTPTFKISEQDKKEYEFTAGLADKDEQLSHVLNNIGDKFYGNATSHVAQSAFVLIGAGSQWPHALVHVLYAAIQRWLKLNNNGISKKISPEPVHLYGRIVNNAISPESHLWELLAEALSCSPKRKEIGDRLGNEKVPNIFFRSLSAKETQNPALVHGVLEAWESIELPQYSPRHILILSYEYSDRKKSQGLSRVYIHLPWSKRQDSLLEKIKQYLLKETKGFSKKEVEAWVSCHFLPEMTSPNQHNIKDWAESHFEPGQVQQVKNYVIDEIKAEHKTLKELKKNAAHINLSKGEVEMHHYPLKEILVNALEKFS